MSTVAVATDMQLTKYFKIKAINPVSAEGGATEHLQIVTLRSLDCLCVYGMVN